MFLSSDAKSTNVGKKQKVEPKQGHFRAIQNELEIYGEQTIRDKFDEPYFYMEAKDLKLVYNIKDND